jgi:hypothetical protein
VYIISDNQKVNYSNFDTTKFNKFRPSFYFLTIGQNSKMDFNNLSLDSVKFITRIFQQNKSLLVSGKVFNHSVEKKDNTFLSMSINNERVAQRKYSVHPQYTNEVEISSNLKNDKIVNGYLELEVDALEEDNKRYFGIIMPEKPKVAYVTSEPNPFVLSALGYGQTQSFCTSEIFSISDFNSKDILKYDILIISSYINLSEGKLNDYINNGGRIFFITSNELKEQNEIFSKINISATITTNYPSGQQGTVSYIMKSHPLFEGVFVDETNTNSPDNIRINQLSKIEEGLPIIETTAGNLLTEVKKGDGLMLFLGVSPDDDWSNLQNSTLFPIIIYRGLLYLSMLPELSKEIEIGEPAQVVIPSKFAKGSNFKIIDPKQIETPINSPALPSGVILTLNNINYPGNYFIYNSMDEPVGIISANISKNESDLTIFNKENIQKLFETKYGEDVHLAFIDDLSSLRQKIERVRTGTELWYFLIVLAIIVAISELVVQRVMKSEVVED